MIPPKTEISLQACLDRHSHLGGQISLAAVATVDSSNRLARRIAGTYLANDRPVPRLILLAREQTAGRGRRGRTWSSPAGQGIYATLLLPLADAEAVESLPMRVPLLLCAALDGVGVGCTIKWPNDLVVAGRKLGGILIESLAGSRAVIVGYGINGNQREAELPTPEATSLRLIAGAELDLSRLAVDLATGLLGRLDESAAAEQIVEAYRRRSAHRPGDRLVARLGDERFAGRFVGFDERGGLCLDTEQGTRVLSSADLLTEELCSAAVGEVDQTAT